MGRTVSPHMLEAAVAAARLEIAAAGGMALAAVRCGACGHGLADVRLMHWWNRTHRLEYRCRRCGSQRWAEADPIAAFPFPGLDALE